MTNPVRNHWKTAAKKSRNLKDPWECLGFDTLPEVLVKRHVYNPNTKTWWKDDIKIKIEGRVI